MTTTYPAALDEMFALFRDAWNTGATAIVGYVPEVRWPGVEEPDKPETKKYWARVSTQTVLERQATFRNGDDKRYTTDGLLFVQIFCPMSDARAMERGRNLAVLARNAFRGEETSSSVWFRNARINELSPDGKAYRFNVVTEYEYDELA